MAAPVVVGLDEGLDLCLEVTGQEVVFEQHSVLLLGLRIDPRAAHMIHLLAIEMTQHRDDLHDGSGKQLASADSDLAQKSRGSCADIWSRRVFLTDRALN